MGATLYLAVAVIEDDCGRVLVVRKRGTDVFLQPGGKIERGETPEAALAREIAEELSAGIAPGTLRPLGRFEAPAAHEAETRVVADAFRVVLTRPPVPGAEIEDLTWVDPAAPDQPLAELSRRHIMAALLQARAECP